MLGFDQLTGVVDTSWQAHDGFDLCLDTQVQGRGLCGFIHCADTSANNLLHFSQCYKLEPKARELSLPPGTSCLVIPFLPPSHVNQVKAFAGQSSSA
jgi:hypothetical protein